jgi:uncharacterized membrane protein YgcG
MASPLAPRAPRAPRSLRLRPLGLAALAPLSLVLAGVLALTGDARAKGTEPGDLPNGGLFTDADSCNACHGGGVAGDTTLLPFDTWAGSMMANAARDPLFFAALEVANVDEPGSGTFCLRCHSPIAYVRGHATPPDGSGFDQPLPGQTSSLDVQGVACDTCHRALEAPEPGDFPYVVGNAQLYFDENTAKRGPYPSCSDPMAPECQGADPPCSCSPAHPTQQVLTLGDSKFCGQCHQVTNPGKPLRDLAGNVVAAEFPLDTTYQEWELSAFGPGQPDETSCADCHMPRRPGMHPVQKVFPTLLRPDPREHMLVGGNYHGIQMVMAANPERAAAFPGPFDLALEKTLAMLESSVEVTLVSAPDVVLPGESFDVTVRVENLAGHKFPTGYAENRRAWIALALTDGMGGERVLLGAYDADTGELVDEAATHVYRAQHGMWDGTQGVAEEHLVLHDMILRDTRIPPRGFSAELETEPTGEIDFADGQGGYLHYDEVTFTVTAPSDAFGVWSLEARVLFQAHTKHYVDVLTSVPGTDPDVMQRLLDAYEATGEAPPIVIETASASVDLGPDPNQGGGGAGGGGAGGAAPGGGGAGGGLVGGGGAGGAAPPAAPAAGGCGCRLDASGPEPSAVALSATLVALGLAGARRRRPRARS